MVPSKCRPAGVGRPAHSVSANNYGVQLVLQSTSSAERNRALELRLHKEQPYLHNRFLQHDLEKNHPGKLADGRLSPLSRSKKACLPIAANFVDVPSLEMKYSQGSLAVCGDGSFPNPLKYRVQQGCHNVSANGPDSNTYGITGFPLVFRSAEEKIQLSDRMTLERQKLTVCPLIDGEEHLRLLSFQHNFITRIQNVSNLQRLIFLDLYDNQIEEISGLSTLRCLRVLSLGNNRIRRISNLDNLVNLDVLDLHGNQISVLENLSHLKDLRMLNLARNCLTHAENLSGLDSLLELNLRYNKIRSVKDADTLPSLQRLFLSFNNISGVEDILCLADSASISELTLDGNPIAQEAWYKPTILHHMMQLRQLDMKKITEEERRLASVALRKEEEKRRETHRQTLLKEKKRLTICNIAHHWEVQQSRLARKLPNPEHLQGEEPCQNNRNAACEFLEEEGSSLETILGKAVPGLESHLVEIDGDTLCLYGSGALESLDRNWSLQTAGNIVTIAFIFIDFDEIIPALSKLKIKFPNFLHLKFKETNLSTLQQFNALAHLRRLEQLTVETQGNPVVSFTLWKFYVLFRLSHFNLQKINGSEVTQNDMIMAERLFGILAYVASSNVPYYRLISLLGDCRKKQLCFLLEAKGKKFGTASDNGNNRRKPEGENSTRSVLTYISGVLQVEKQEELKEKKTFCQSYIQQLVKEAADVHMKYESLQKLWPQMFVELVRDAVMEMHHKGSHRRHCLQRLAEEKL
ncbi:leucine-rich repeat-containing protein 49 isoform X1 [Thamnophis elegans]|uniref:leucine-rich repeat-containing protein 49 isoform X1 n=1 Tax=Thamnophis elegans TaxID=35005 RepID=UPI001378BCAA|nr:leucine-rich repeat-containing protein 49 isoform X1 [Thamnophis elegans]